MADAEVDAAEGVDLLVAHLVGLPEIAGDDDLAGVGAVGGGLGRCRLRLVRFRGPSGSPAMRVCGRFRSPSRCAAAISLEQSVTELSA